MDEVDGEYIGDDEAKILRFKAEKLRLEVEEKTGELIPVEQWTDFVESVLVDVRTRLLALPARMAPLLENRSSKEIRDYLDDEIHQTLEELSRAIEQGPATSEDPE